MRIKDLLALDYKNNKVDPNKFIDRLDLFDSDHYIYSVYLNFEEIENPKLEVFSIFNKMSDYRRGAWIYVAHFNEIPFAIWYEAGREGDDSKAGYIFNKEEYENSLKYIRELIGNEETNSYNIADIEEDMDCFDSIYGYDITKEVFKLNLDLKFKKGDIVKLDATELNCDDEYITCEILDTFKDSSFKTYYIKFLSHKRIPTFDIKSKSNNIHIKHLKLTDVIAYTDILPDFKPYIELDEGQKNAFDKYISEITLDKYYLSFKEEFKLQLIDI